MVPGVYVLVASLCLDRPIDHVNAAGDKKLIPKLYNAPDQQVSAKSDSATSVRAPAN